MHKFTWFPIFIFSFFFSFFCSLYAIPVWFTHHQLLISLFYFTIHCNICLNCFIFSCHSPLLTFACIFLSFYFSLSIFDSFLQSVKGPFALWASGPNRWAEEALQCFLKIGITFLLPQSILRSSISISSSSHPLPLKGLLVLLQSVTCGNS